MDVALTSYLLSLAVFIPASGQVADRLGSRLVFRAAIAVFTISSVFCGLAPSVTVLIVSRILQGVGGAMMVPVGRLLLLRSVAKDERISAMAWVLVPAMLGPLVGPPLGGLIVTYASWRWIFAMNIPVGILGIVLVTVFIPEVREPDARTFDIKGMVLSGVAMLSVIVGLEMIAQERTGREWVAVVFASAVCACLLYWRHARKHDNPVLDLGLLRIRTFRVATAASALFRLAIGALPFLLPLMLQLGFGVSAAESGIITFASAAGSIAVKGATERLLRRFGYRNTLIWNGLLSTVFLIMCGAFRPDWPLEAIYAVLLVGGAARSLQLNAYGSIAYADISNEKMSDATSFYSMTQQVSSTASISISAAVLSLTLTFNGHLHAELADFTTAFLAVAAISLIPLQLCRYIAADAGSEMSGHVAKTSGAIRC